MFQQIWSHISGCVPCNQRSLRKQKTPLQDTEIPPFAFAKVSMDLSGPYPTSQRGNRYIMSFVDWYSGWPEAFPLKDKSATTIANLILNEIFPRFGSCLCIVSDNGTEVDNKVVREVFQKLNIHHIKTSTYHPCSNAKVERFHGTLHDVLAKRLNGLCDTWDEELNQTLAAIRFNSSETTGHSPFFLLYGRDVILPVDNLLKPHRKYCGEEEHKHTLQAQHEAFVRVYRRTKKCKKRQAKYADKGTVPVEFKVGDPVYLKVHQRESKLHPKWRPHYRVLEKLSPATFRLKEQLSGKVVTSHAEHMRKAKVDWKISSSGESNTRASKLVMGKEEASSSFDSDDTDPTVEKSQHSTISRDSVEDSDEDIPLSELKTRLQKLRAESGDGNQTSMKNDSDDNIPLTRLQKKLKALRECKSPDTSSIETQKDEPVEYTAPHTQVLVTLCGDGKITIREDINHQ